MKEVNNNPFAPKTEIKIENSNNAVERDIIVNGMHIRIKSVFSGKIPLEKALGNIAVRKLSDNKKN